MTESSGLSTASLSPAATSVATGSPHAPGDLLAGRFRLIRVLGKGGSGTVFLADDTALRSQVAVKVLHAERLTPEGFARLRREVLLARQVASPRLLPTYDVEREGDTAFLTMEPAAGSLVDRLADGPLPIDAAITHAGQLLEGLAALHGAGIVHRDVKPANLLLDSAGGLKLADFGLAVAPRRGLTNLTAEGQALGTLGYAAPEQVLGEKVDTRADLYSAGVVLFELLTGQLPHAATTPFGSLVQRLSRQPADPRTLRPEIPVWLAKLVRRLLAPRPNDRYVSAGAALRDLKQRRSSMAPRVLRRLLLLGLAATVLAFAAWAAVHQLGRRFDHMAVIGPASARAVSARGDVLWERHNVNPVRNFRPIRWGNRPVVAALLPSPVDFSAQSRQTLHLLDPLRGDEVGAVELPSAADLFAGFADSYGYEMDALDLDGDGADELLISYVHIPLYPSYHVLVEPRLQRTRLVFAASGHHRLVGAVDLDRDGRSELLLGGINNRLGWHVGLAALQLDPPVNQLAPDTLAAFQATSPELRLGPRTSSQSLRWYALGPHYGHARVQRLEIDETRRELTLVYTDGGTWRLDFAGLAPAPAAPGSTAVRSRWRELAWAGLRDGMRLGDLGEPSSAVARLSEAETAAENAGEVFLAAMLGRLRARELVTMGVYDKADALFSRLAQTDHRDEVAIDAARAFHRARQLDAAVRWYERSIAWNDQVRSGRGLYEAIEGLLFARFESGERAELVAAIDRITNATATADPILRIYPSVARWLIGEPAPQFDAGPGNPDLTRYWSLELRFANGEKVEALLPIVREEVERQTEGKLLTLGLEAVLLAASGNIEEARDLLQKVLEGAAAAAEQDAALRVHLPILRRRSAEVERRLSSRRN